ncbi:MAG: hypothetical protein KGI41_02430 [Patescibacteria group bacterium]|nr:hypothetical protein [Patescibacteria group bacterium]MDE1966071.1 hypothetical protein [Patescibacteria group bacterium]
MEDGTFYITQSRPITTLTPPVAKEPPDGEEERAKSDSESSTERGNTAAYVREIKALDWYQDWSGLYSQIEASLDADAYFGHFENACGMQFSHALVTLIGETAIGWLPTSEGEAIGAHLVRKLQEPAFLKEWTENFRNYFDQVSAFLKLPREELLARYREYADLYPQLAPYTIGTKLAFNALPLGSEPIAAELEKVRKYTERIYKDSALMTSELCRTIAERSGYPTGAVRTLTVDEISRYGTNGTLPSQSTLEARALAGAVYLMPGKSVLLSRDETEDILASFTSGVMKDGALVGTSAHPGIVQGTCRIVFDFRDAVMHDGDILVTPMTNPYFVPLMKKAGAIVTDGGGMLSHAAIVARELGKPCIIGTKVATQVLKDGDMVEVDAEKGVVRKV